jgi:Mg-chelatase subunit ChlD
MNNQWILEYLNNHPKQRFWEYLQNNPEQSEILLNIDYSNLNDIIKKLESLHQIKKTGQDKTQLSLEEQILLTLIFLIQKLDFHYLSLLFAVSESTVSSLCLYWKSICQENHFIWYKINLVKRNLPLERTGDAEALAEEDNVFLDSSVSLKPTVLRPVSGTFHSLVAPALAPALESPELFLGACSSSSTSLPLNKKTKLLPHDGLFVRRNNQFGKKLTIGIKDLIEQGLLIDQTNIRFDDFIALNSEQVPSPQADNSIAVSYGIASIPLNQKRDEKATHYLEIALKTSDVAPVKHPVTQTLPVNYIFVIDVSSSMRGDKLDNVKASIRELFVTMRENDVIGIIEFNDQPRTLLKATPKGKIKLDEFSEVLSKLIARGGTDIKVAISFGVDEIRRYGNNNTLNHIYLFSDGNPTSGETNWIKIRQNVDTKTRGNIRLSTFAFGSDANIRELDALAGLTGGKSTFVTHLDDIKISLQEELSRREHLAAINVQMQIEIDRDIEILYLYGHDLVTDPAARAAVLQNVESAKKIAEKEIGVQSKPDLITQEKGIKIFVPDLAVGETYWVVFELAIPEEKRQTAIGKATVQYVDTFARKNQKPELELSFAGNLPSDLVVEHALALWTSEIAFYTLDDLYQKDIDTAQKRIENHVALLSCANDKLTSEYLADDIITLKKILSLAENLGKIRFVSDSYPQNSSGNYLIYSLDEFGRVRNGFNRVDHSLI